MILYYVKISLRLRDLNQIIMKSKPQIFVSILTYNSLKIIEPLLDSLENQTSKNFKTFIFDNKSKDNISKFCENKKNINFVQFDNNSGYSGGYNQACRYLKENYNDFKYFLIVNPDSILSPDLIEEFTNFISKKENFVLASPLIEFDGKYFSSGSFFGPTFSNTSKEVKIEDEYEKVKWNSGCCLLVNTEKIKGELFNDYFMYYEDTQLSARTAIKYNQNYCIHNTFVIHGFDPKPYAYKTYYCELNRYKFLADTFNKKYLLLYFPVYFLLRFLILLNIIRVFGLSYPYKEYFIGNLKGLVYFFKKIFSKGENCSFSKTFNFCYKDINY